MQVVVGKPLRGWLPDSTMPEDVRKRCLEAGPVRSFADVHQKFVALAAPEAQAGTDYDIPNEPPCFDQEEEGACVIHSTLGSGDIILSLEQLTWTMLARNFVYWNCREVMGCTDQDSGTYVHLAVALLGQVGACREAIWPYTQDNMFTKPTPDCYPEASDNTFKAWYQIADQAAPGQPSRLDQLEAAIRSNHPVPFGTPVTQAIQQYQAGQVLDVPSVNDNIIGGHSMAVVGVHYLNGVRVWRIRNSWGVSYGDNGHLLMSDAYMGWVNLTDLWALTRANSLMF